MRVVQVIVNKCVREDRSMLQELKRQQILVTHVYAADIVNSENIPSSTDKQINCYISYSGSTSYRRYDRHLV